MRKVRIIGLKKNSPSVIRFLHERGIIELREVNNSTLDKGKPLEIYETVSEQLIRIRALKSGMVPDGTPKPTKFDLKEALSECGKIKIDLELAGLQERRDAIIAKLEQIVEEHNMLSELDSLGIDFSTLSSKRLDFYLGKIGVENFSKLRLGVSGITKEFSLAHVPAKGKLLCLIACKKGTDLRKAFDASGFAEIEMPKLSTSIDKRASDMEEEGKCLKKEMDEIDNRIFAISEKYYGRILELEEALAIEADRARVATKFGTTKDAFVLEGWIVKKELAKLTNSLREEFGSHVMIEEIETHELAPTVLSNPAIVGPLEFLVEFFSLPRSDEIDPSFVLFFTFPIIYGMMIGDVGYGLLSFLMAGLIILKTKPGLLQGFAKLWAYGAVPTILFGIFFDEWMGFKFQHLMELFGTHVPGTFIRTVFGFDFGLSRIENVTGLLLLTIITGMLHLTLGLIFGFINERKHSMTHALAKLGWIGILWSGLVLVGGLLFHAFGIPGMAVAGVIFLVSLVLIIRADGIIGIFEIPGIAGNALSYARIAAVGLAGLIPAEFAINKLLLPNPKSGLVLMLIMIPIFIGLHVFNTFLAMFESLVQGARLNLVEHYGKFFHGGGSKFAPFHVKRIYTK